MTGNDRGQEMLTPSPGVVLSNISDLGQLCDGKSGGKFVPFKNRMSRETF